MTEPATETPRAAAAPAWYRDRRFWRGTALGTALGVVFVLLAAVLLPLVYGDDTEDDTPLVVLSGQDDSIGRQRQQRIDEWNAVHEVKARIVELSPIADEQHSEMLARAQSDHPDVDVYNLDVTWTAEFAAAGHLLRLDESLAPAGEFLTGPLSTCRYDGHLYALPFNADVGLLYYRKDLLDRIGQSAPQDWDTLARQIDAVRRSGVAVDGYLGQLADYEGLTVTALEMIWGEHGTVVDAAGHVLPSGDDVGAVDRGLARLKQLSPTDLPPLDETTAIQRFHDGAALFMRNWPIADRRLQEPQDGPAPKYEVTRLPGGSAALGGQNLAVSSRTTRPQAARELVQFLTSDRSEQLLYERGGLPATRRAVYQDPLFAHDDTAKTLREQLDKAHPRPAVAHYTEFSTAFRTAVLGYLRGGPPTDDRLRPVLEAALQGRLPPEGND